MLWESQRLPAAGASCGSAFALASRCLDAGAAEEPVACWPLDREVAPVEKTLNACACVVVVAVFAASQQVAHSLATSLGRRITSDGRIFAFVENGSNTLSEAESTNRSEGRIYRDTPVGVAEVVRTVLELAAKIWWSRVLRLRTSSKDDVDSGKSRG